MQTLSSRLAAGEILIAEGAMGTLLIEAGLEPGGCPEAFALERPEVLARIAREYLAAGAQVIHANTFGASPLKLAPYHLEGRMEEINRRAVEIVRAEVGGRAYVAASCGPSGRMLAPYGDAQPDDVETSYRRQMACLIAAGVDLISIETMMDLTEAQLAVRAAKSVSGAVPVAVTMTFDATPRGFYTIMGVDIPSAAEGLIAAGADIVGSNCGNGIERMVAIARAFTAVTDRPLLIQSNAGLPETRDGKLVYSETPEFMAGYAGELIAAGARILGGCCGTTPAHIRALRAAVDARRA